ncbi:MAG: FliG C-terminal domain-containing protein [Spirochaetia bacterium]
MEDSIYPITILGSEILGRTVGRDHEYKVKLYDFKRPDKFSKDQLRTVQFIHNTIGRLWAPVLSGIVGRPVGVRCSGVDQLTFGEFLESVPQIGAFVPTSMTPLKGSMLMQIDGSLAQFLVRTACGNAVQAGSELDQPGRTLTDMECVVLRDMVEKMVPAIEESWRNVIELTTGIIDVGTDPQDVQIVPPHEMIILGSMETTIDGSRAFVNFAIPYLTIEPIIGRLNAQWWYHTTRRDSAGTVSSRATDLPVDVELFAEADPIPLADLSAIASGEPLELPTLSAGITEISAGGVTVAEVAVDPVKLAMADPLALGVMTHRSDPATSITGAAAEGSSLPALLSTAVEGLTRQIKEVRRAVEEIREDRETLLADLTDRPVPEIDPTRESEIDRRHHHDIAVALADEDPTTIGFVLAGLAPETAAAVLSDLDRAAQPDVVRSIMAVKDGDRSLHRKLLSFIGRRITRSAEMTTSGGPDVVAEILNHTPRSVEKHVMDTFLSEDKAFFEEIAKRLFVFEDFVLVDPVAIGKVAARVSTEELALAMKGIPSEVAEHITAALDDDATEGLGHAIDNLGRVRRRDVEAAQHDMVEELRQLERAGEVVVARPDEVIE